MTVQIPKQNTLRSRYSIGFAVSFFVVAFVWLHGSFNVTADTIGNPYADVDWDRFNQHKVNLHTHTTESDGGNSPDEMIDAYHELGYSVLALTDHNRMTWPWGEYDRDPEELGMLPVRGTEASSHHHMGSYFNG